MNKLDNLLSIVDNLQLKSDAILQGCQHSTDILDKVLNNNNSISTFDIRIDDTNQLLRNNYQFTSDFNELVSKTHLFDHNFLNNDAITNINTFENLNNEYNYLKLKFGIDTSDIPHEINNPSSETRPPLSNRPSNVNIPKLSSVSDLSLKPLRCKSNKVYKKKSHYKISNIFNNPILNSPVTPDSDQFVDNNQGLNNRIILDLNNHDFDNDSIENIMDVTYPHSNDTTPDMEFPEFQKFTTPANFDINEKPYMHEFLPSTIECDLNDNDSVLSDSLEGPDFNFEQYLRKSRINLNKDSYPYVVRKSVSDASINIGGESIDPFDNDKSANEFSPDLSSSSLKDNQVPKTRFNFKFHNPIDNIKPSHEFISPTFQSIHSTPMSSSPKSNLSNTLTEKLCSDVYSSCSHDFNATTPRRSDNNFQNHLDPSVKENRSGSISESVFGSDSFFSKVMNVSTAGSPKAKTNMKSQADSSFQNHEAKTPSKKSHPSNSPFSFFNFIGSPEKVPSISKESRPQPRPDSSTREPRRPPVLGKSLAEGFFQLMQTELSSPLPPKLNSTPILTQSSFESSESSNQPTSTRRRKRNKLNELKSVPKSTPILIQADNHIKRLPPNSNNGSSSSLILDSNKSFKINHGDTSLFKKPIVQHFSSRSLQDALGTSIYPY